MQRHAHGLVARDLTQMHIQAARQLVDGRLAGAIRVPAARRVPRDRPHPRRHERQHRASRHLGQRRHLGVPLRQHPREVLDQQQWAQRVDLEGGQRARVGDGPGGFFHVQDPWDAESESEPAMREARFAVSGCRCDCGFV